MPSSPFTYSTYYTFSNAAGGDLSFTNITSTEQDFGTFVSFTDSAGDPTWINPLGVQGLEWGGFEASVNGPNAETQFTIGYTVNVTNPNEAITSVSQFYVVDVLTKNASATAVETITDSSGNVVATMSWNGANTTGASINLGAGYQQLNVSLTITESVTNGTPGNEASISTIDQDFGQTPLSQMALIGDNVFIDNTPNHTGVQTGVDAGPGLPGVTVNLLEDINGTFTQVASTTTDNNGLYQFIANPGTYEVQFVQPVGYNFSQEGALGSDLDSTANQTSGITPSFVVTQGQTISYVDEGLWTPGSHQNGSASIGDNVWLDSNDTGIQSGVNAGPGVANVTVNLLLEDSNGNFNQVATTTTNSSGLYSFDTLNAGTYEVQFQAPNGYFFSPQNADNGGFDDQNSTPNTATGITQPITLATGQAITSVDAGLVPVDASITLQKFVSIDGGASWVAAPTTSGEPVMLYDNPAVSPEFEFVVTNNGNVALSNVTLTDSPQGIGALGNLGSLAVGASDTVVATGVWGPGQNTDIATTTGTSVVNGFTSTPTATATGNYFGATPGVSIEKFVSVDGGNTWVSAPTTAGEPSELSTGPAPEFEFVVTNTGNVAENVVVYDTPHINSNSLGAVGTITNLGVGASSTIVASGTWAAGQQTDIASAVGSYTDSTGFFTTSSTVFANGNYFGDQPQIGVQKLESLDGGATWITQTAPPGEPIALSGGPAPEFEFVVTNLGNVALNNVTLSDAAVAGSAVNLGTLGNIGSLGVGASTTITATGTWGAGQNTDLATATGTVIVNGITATPTAIATENYFGATPSIAVQKFVSVNGGANWVLAPTTSGEPTELAGGPAPEYEFVVTNTGNVLLRNVTLSDSPLNIGAAGTIGTLASGASTTIVATGTWAAGQNTDVATATGTVIANGITATPSATATANYFGDSPSITLQKFVSVNGGTSWVLAPTTSGEPTELAGGPAPEYEFVVTNNGNVALNNVSLSDAVALGGAINLGSLGAIGSLAAGASDTIVATGTWAASQNTDNAKVVGTVIANGITSTPSATATANYFGDSPSIALVKYVSVNGGSSWVLAPTASGEPTELAGGPAPEYEFVVTNNGNVALSNVSLTDSVALGGAINLGALGNIGSLAVGATDTIIATGTWAAGQNTDNAKVVGTVIANGITSTPSATATANYFGDSPSIGLQKYVSLDGGHTWVISTTTSGEPTEMSGGSAPEYEFVVTNLGNVALNNVTLTDTIVAGGSINLGALGNIGSLGVGATDTIVATGTWAAGQNTDDANVTGTVIANGITSTPSASSSANWLGTTPLTPGVSIVKTVTSVGGVAGDQAATYVGEVIDYKVVVTNTGNEALTNVNVGDTTLGTTLGTLTSLGIGQSVTYTASQTVTQADLNQILGSSSGCAGSVTHTGPGSGAGSGCTAWFSSSFNPSSCANGATYNFKGITCIISGQGTGGSSFTEKCPDATITFSNSCKTPSTVFNSSTNCWVTTLPANCSPGSIFLSGLPVTVPSGCNFNNSTITWSIGQSTNNCGASNISWDASCGGFDNFNQYGCNGLSNYNQIGVQSCDNIGGISSGWGWYSTTTCAGTPQNQYNSNNCNSGSYTQGYGDNSGSCGGSGCCTSTPPSQTNVSGSDIINTATVTDSQGATGTSTASTLVEAAAPGIGLQKYVSVDGGNTWVLAPTTTSEPADLAGGPAPEYEFVVSNTGNVALTNVTLTDTAACGGAVNLGTLGNIGSLAIGATDTIVATGTWAAGQNTDNANVTGKFIANGTTATPSAAATANYFGDSPGIGLQKYVSLDGGKTWIVSSTISGEPTELSTGAAPEYEFVVTNNGNVALTNVTLTDTVTSGGAINLGTLGNIGALAVGATDTVVATGTWVAGQNTDVANVAGTVIANGITSTPSATSSANWLGTTPPPPSGAGITVIKVPSAMVVGTNGQVSYTFDVINTGTTALSNVQITDNIGTASNPDYITPVLQTQTANGVLLPGQTWVYTATINESGDYSSKGGSQSCGISGSNLDSGCTAWFNSSFTPTSCKDGATYNFKDITCTIKGPNCGTFTVNVPDACVTFSNSCTQPTTTYNTSENCWVTTLPANCNPGNVFLSGLPWGIPSGCDLDGASCSWSIGESANNCGSSSVQWQTGCTGYSSFSQNGCDGNGDYNQIGVKVCDNSTGYGSGGDCNQGYGYNYGDSNGYCGGSYGGWGGWGGSWWGSGSNWNGSGNDCAGTPENQNCGSNSGSSNCGGNNGCGGDNDNSGTCGNGGSSGSVTCGQLGDSSEADTVTVTAQTLGKGFSLGDAANYGIIAFAPSTFKGSSNSPITGNVGVGLASNCGGTTTIQLSSDKITGNLVATGNKPGITGGTVTGTISGNSSTLSADINTLLTLSQTLAAETGTTEKLTTGTTINASAGTLDSSGNEVFTITQWANNITINGSGANAVVLNIATNVTPNLDNVTLTGGITANQVLFNDQDNDTITGVSGDTFNGTFLAPNATFSVSGVKINGHLFGGANGQTFSFTSGATLTTPANTSTTTPTLTTVTASDSTEVQVLSSTSPITLNGSTPTGSLSSLYGTAEKLEFAYNPSNTVSLKQIQSGLASVSGSNSNSMAFIEISNNSNAFASNATIYFEGEVQTGEKIYADATLNQLTNTPIAAPNNHFSTATGADIYAYVFASQAAFNANQAPVQTIAYNTSGSQAMHLGDQIGSLSVIGYVGANGGHLVS